MKKSQIFALPPEREMLSQVAFFVLAVIRKLHRGAFFLYNTVTQRKGAATMENSFAAKHPELVCEWSEKNLPLTPEQIPYGSNKIYWWHGACGHEWTASAKSRHAGEKCPICSGARILVGFNDLASVKPELAAEWSEKNKPLLPTMVTVGSHKKVIWKGKCGHEWVAQIKNRVQLDSGCPYCSHNKVLVGFNDLASLFPEVAAEWSDRNLPLKPTDVMAFANKKVWWKCSHGHEWYTLISTRSGGSKCPYCSGITVLPGFNDFQTLYPELAEEWSEQNAPLTPDRISVKSRQNVWWKCKVCGHEWKSVIYSRTKGTTCPVCADRAVKEGYNDLATTDPHLIPEWDFEQNKKLSPYHISRNSLYSVWWRCKHGHTWKATVADRAINGEDCRICEAEYQWAFPKLLIAYYAKKEGLKVRLDSEKDIGIRLEAYLPDERIAIETTDKPTRQNSDRERIKDYICSRQGIRLFRVPYEQAHEEEYAGRIKAVFRSTHIFLRTDERADVKQIREMFFLWKERK